ncbi:dephospho-CoA kinase [Effusibacillus pohliae]|uniref:dephospho-CoA kinase n=1 Tax=Effusibacillus pohliae TaxID=232270 RepID=UPI00036DE520|nr:dephospho-CoA kinase [Effusibacillus pohliae]
MIAGLTGGIATGKSTVSNMFRQLGAAIVDADRIARLVVEPDRPAWRDLVAHFGEGILLADRTIDRVRLGQIVFSDASQREVLNRIVHPRVREEADRQTADFLRENPRRPVIHDVPLLIETGLYRRMDKVIVVYVDEPTQMRRLMQRNCLSEEEAIRRIRAQMPIEQKKAYADYLIDNRGTLEETRSQVERVWEELKAAT